MESKIKVKTIGYYHKDDNMNAKIGLLPKQPNEQCIEWMNSNKNAATNKLFELPENDDENEKFEKDYLKPLLSFYRQKNWDERPDFVTNRNLLTATASSKEATLVILAYKKDGVIYMERPDEKRYGAKMKSSAENEIMLTEDEKENRVINSDSYAVLEAKIDAVSINPDGKLEHHELKLLGGEVRNGYNWKHHSCSFYWQAFFGKCDSLIISARTWSTRPHHVYSVKKIKPSNILRKVKKLPSEHKWTVADGKSYWNL